MKRKMMRPKLADSSHRQRRPDAPAPTFDAQPAAPTVTQHESVEAEIEDRAAFVRENPNPVFRISRSGLLLYANPASSQLLVGWGWAVGQSVTPDWRVWIAAACDSGADKEFEIQATDRILALNLHPLGPAGCVNVYGHDVTQLRQAEKSLHASQEWLASIFDTASEAIISTDEQQRILLFNKAAETIFGYRSDEVLGQPLTTLLPDRYSEIHSRHMHGFGAAAEQAHEMGGSRMVVGRRKDGTEFSLQAGISKTSNEGPMTFTFIGTDMTERQRAEQSLRNVERRYRSLFENMLDGYALCQMLFDDHQQPQDFIYLEVNHAFETLTGLTEVVGKKVTEVIPGIKQSNPELFEIYGRVAATGSPERFETYLEALGRAWLSVAVYSPARGYFVAVFDNITERKQADEALRNSEQRYRSLFDDSPIELWEEDYSAVKQRLETLRQQGITDFRAYFQTHPAAVAECAALVKVLDVNRAALKQHGVSSKDELLQGLSRFFGPESYPAFVSELVNVAQGLTDMQWERPVTTLSGHPLYASLHWSTVPGHEETLSRVIISSIDITERKRAEESLAVFRALIDRSNDAIEIIEPDTARFLDVNEKSCLDLGYTRQEYLSLTVFDIDPALDRASFPAAIGRLRDVGSMLWEGFHRRKDGSMFAVEVSLTYIRLDRDYVVSVARDITERKRADEALAQERNMLRTLIDNLPDAIYVKDRESRFVIKNLADARKMGAATPDETVGKTDFDYYPRELAARYTADDRAVIDSGQAIINREEPITEATGRTGWVSTTKVPLRDGQGAVVGLVGIGHDITASKWAEAELKQRLDELEAVNRVSTAMRAAQTLDQLLSEWLDVTLAITHASGGSIWLYDHAKDELRPVLLRGWAEPASVGPVRPLKLGEDINGQVYMTRQPYTSSNFHDDPRTAATIRERLPPGGGVCVPIRAEDQVIGTFALYLPQPRPATPGEVQLVTTLSEIAGNAIQRMRLHEQTEQQLSRMTALRSVDQAISSSLDLQMTLTDFLDQVVTQLSVDAADVLLLGPHDQMLSFAAGRGFRTDDFQQTHTRVGEGRAGRAVLERRTVISDLQAYESASKRTGLLTRENFASYIGVPLIAKGRVLGALEIFHRSQLDPAPEWLDFLSALASQAAIALDNAELFNNLQRANSDLQLAYDATIEGWSRALDLRDKETEGHTQRVTETNERLARAMGVSDAELIHIRRGALLHDIGKMGVPDSILLKPGPLTDDQWTMMRQHPVFAYEMLSSILYLQPALDIPYCHHEKWDGTGYPRGLKGRQIPLAARIFAVVDVWDALRSDRPYRRAWPDDKVRAHLRSLAGVHFDPQVVETFLRLLSATGTPGDS
jgi:PAS domain S-box-containing protein/putative nucleotidyltransferase with HDIG domain